jgi:hypothetical protein
MSELVLRRSEWMVERIGRHSEAVQLIRLWHYSASAPNTSTYRFGLYERASWPLAAPMGVALFIPPTRTAAEANAHGHPWTGVLSLSRLVVAPEMPKNAASFLLGAAMRLIDRQRWPVLLTYADTNQGHTGAIYKATNWQEDGPVPAGDVWELDGALCGRKRGGFTYTADEMRALGATRRESAPKIRFVHLEPVR